MNEQTQCQMGAEEKDWLSPEEGWATMQQ
jgi:hypothetical protein